MDATLSKYGQQFQITALSLFFKNKSFTNQIKDILKPDYFDNKYTRWICEKGIEYLEKYKTFPTESQMFEDLKTIIDKSIPENNKKLYFTTLDSIKDVTLEDRVFIEEEINNFCLTKHALLKVEEQENNILAGNFDKAREIAFETYKPLNVASEELDFTKDYGVLFNENIKHNPVSLPFPTFNANTKGGPGAGDLVVVCGQSSLGKTACLTAIARHACAEGKKVLYFSLETKNTQLMSRALAGLVGIKQEDLDSHQSLVAARLKELKGEIKFIRYKATQARTATMKLKIEELKSQGFFPELIIVDGLNQVKLPPGMRVTDTNEKFEYLAEELRDLGSDLLCPVFTAFQSNRGGFNTEYADEQNIGKAIEVYQVCDIMIMLTQSIPMQEIGEVYIQLLKNRLGKKGITIKAAYDPNLGTFIEMAEVLRSELMSKSEKNNQIKTIEKVQEKIEQYKRNNER